MKDEVSHCQDCRTEFVAGVTRCSDCGRPVTPGELPPRKRNDERDEARDPRYAQAPSAEATVDPPDTELTSIPGEQAELVAKALALEGIPSLLACEGEEQLRGPHEPPKPPIARKRIVDIYVPQSRLDDAREIADSMASGDLIGDQWLETTIPGESETAGQSDFERAMVETHEDDGDAPGYQAGAQPVAPRAEGGNPSLLLFFIVTLLIAAFLFLL